MEGPSMHNEDEAVAAINIVPLVDVLLVVLIIFMVTAVFSTVSALELELPKGSRPENSTQPPAQITVAIDKDNHITVNGIKTEIGDVRTRVQSLLNKNTNKTILILQGDKELLYGSLMPVLQEVSGTGVELTLAFEPPKAK